MRFTWSDNTYLCAEGVIRKDVGVRFTWSDHTYLRVEGVFNHEPLSLDLLKGSLALHHVLLDGLQVACQLLLVTQRPLLAFSQLLTKSSTFKLQPLHD